MRLARCWSFASASTISSVQVLLLLSRYDAIEEEAERGPARGTALRPHLPSRRPPVWLQQLHCYGLSGFDSLPDGAMTFNLDRSIEKVAGKWPMSSPSI